MIEQTLENWAEAGKALGIVSEKYPNTTLSLSESEAKFHTHATIAGKTVSFSARFHLESKPTFDAIAWDVLMQFDVERVTAGSDITKPPPHQAERQEAKDA